MNRAKDRRAVNYSKNQPVGETTKENATVITNQNPIPAAREIPTQMSGFGDLSQVVGATHDN